MDNDTASLYGDDSDIVSPCEVDVEAVCPYGFNNPIVYSNGVNSDDSGIVALYRVDTEAVSPFGFNNHTAYLYGVNSDNSDIIAPYGVLKQFHLMNWIMTQSTPM